MSDDDGVVVDFQPHADAQAEAVEIAHALLDEGQRALAMLQFGRPCCVIGFDQDTGDLTVWPLGMGFTWPALEVIVRNALPIVQEAADAEVIDGDDG